MNNLAFDMERFAVEAEAMVTMAGRYRSDPEFRETVDTDPAAVLAAKGVELPPGREARIVCNTADTFYLVMPEDPNLRLDDEDLGMIAGGKVQAGSAGSVGSASTATTFPSCVSSVGSVGTAGTAAPG